MGYFEEEAVISYTPYLAEIDAAIAVAYWSLPEGARLRDVVRAVRADEAGHRDVNHGFANTLAGAVTPPANDEDDEPLSAA